MASFKGPGYSRCGRQRVLGLGLGGTIAAAATYYTKQKAWRLESAHFLATLRQSGAGGGA